MSSILYVEVTEKRDDTLVFLLVEIKSGYVFVESATLALQLLLESWQTMRRGWLASELQARSHSGFY